jgi:hypothetical protein
LDSELDPETHVPDTVTVYCPGEFFRGTVTFSVAEPVPPGLRVRLVGLRLRTNPCV